MVSKRRLCLTGCFFVVVATSFVFLPMASVWAEPQLHEQTRYYDIRGTTEQQLAQQMKSLGPKGYYAYCNYRIYYHYRSSPFENGCAISSLNVTVRTEYTMPRWIDKQEAPAALQQKWEEWYRCIKGHEEGHRDIGVRKARLVEKSLFTVRGPCNLIDGKMKESYHHVMAAAANDDAEYDRVTDHGRAQGCRFH
jgi:predicted secreted Zn-dependent protease